MYIHTRTRSPRTLVLLCCAFALLFLPALVLAQAPDDTPDVNDVIESETSDTEATAVELVTVANVEIYNALLVRQLEREVEVSFTLANESELVQPGVSYALFLFALGEGADADGYLVDQHLYPVDLTLAPNSEQEITETYQVPAEVPPGQYFLSIEASNDAGLGFAEQDIAEIAISGEPKPLDLAFNLDTCRLEIGGETFGLLQGVDVAEGEDIEFVCEVSNVTEEVRSVQPVAHVFSRTFFGPEVDTQEFDTEVFEASETKLLRVPVSRQEAAGSYQTRLELVDEAGEVVAAATYRHVEQGLSAVILNARFDKEAYAAGDTAYVELMINGRADQFPGSRIGFIDQSEVDYRYDLVLTDARGEQCGTVTDQPFPRFTVLSKHSITIERDCEQMQIAIVAKEGGTVLSQKEFRTEGTLPPKPSFWEQYREPTLAALAAILVVGVLYGAYYALRRRRERGAVIVRSGADIADIEVTKNGSTTEDTDSNNTMNNDTTNSGKGGGIAMLLMFLFASALYFGSGTPAEAKTSCYSTYGGLSTSCVTTSVKYSKVGTCQEQVVVGKADFNPCANRDAKAEAWVNGSKIFSNSCARTSFYGCCHPTMSCDGKGSRAISPGNPGKRSACVDYRLRSWNTSSGALDDNISARVCQSYTVTSCAVNGACGVADGGSYADTPPTASACAAGALRDMRLEGDTWLWSCAGQSGGSIASCSASHAVSGQCGAAVFDPFAEPAPSTDLCSVGTASNVSLSNEGGVNAWVWTCYGSGGGADALCRVEGEDECDDCDDEPECPDGDCDDPECPDGNCGNSHCPSGQCGSPEKCVGDCGSNNQCQPENDCTTLTGCDENGICDPDIEVNPGLIDNGKTTFVRWNPGGNINCKITSTQGDSRIDNPKVTTGNSNFASEEKESSEIYGDATYTISCPGGKKDEDSVRVREQIEDF